MQLRGIQTDIVAAGAMSVTELLDRAIDDLGERTVVAVASKVVSLCESRVVPFGDASKLELIARESERYLQANPHGFHFTITQGTLIPSAGIDESNVGGGYLLWPERPQTTANELRRYLAARFGLREVGVVLTDSTCSPLRRGTSGICLAHSGFRAINDYVGQTDLFGRPFHTQGANVASGLAAAAVLVMGEGKERTPICVIDDLDMIEFQPRDPSADELAWLYTSLEEDLFAPFFSSLPWERGGAIGRSAGAASHEDAAGEVGE